MTGKVRNDVLTVTREMIRLSREKIVLPWNAKQSASVPVLRQTLL